MALANAFRDSRLLATLLLALICSSAAIAQQTPQQPTPSNPAQHQHDNPTKPAQHDSMDMGQPAPQQPTPSNPPQHQHDNPTKPAQHDSMDMGQPAPQQPQPPPSQQQEGMKTGEHGQMDMGHGSMAHAAEDVAQYRSGTSWAPASSPENMWMTTHSGWTLMAHANVFLTYAQTGGAAGEGKLESQNWVMMMEDHALGKAKLELRQMLSAEPGTTPTPGFPQLFQTGETFRGRPLLNYQHPHDLFGEVAALLTVPIGKSAEWMLYGGPAGEPALGPPAFVHRASAVDIPDAPLSHHVQDSTHISYGVVTTGVRVGKFRVEGSVFNGREPDEHRYDFDMGALDSWSVRASVAPTRNWVAQYSYGHLTKPEALEPGDTERQTASVAYNRPFARGNWAASLIWGRNFKEAARYVQNSYLAESDLRFLDRNTVTTRLELVDKDEIVPGASFRIGAYTFGGVRELMQNAAGELGMGAAVTFYSKPGALDAMYGKNPTTVQVFLRFRPPGMK